MISESQNSTGWQERFLSWERSGGAAEPEKNLLWEKLQSRLHSRKRKKKLYWLHAAAAAIIIVIACCLLLWPRQTKTPSGESFAISPVKNNSSTPIVKQQEATPVTKDKPIINTRQVVQKKEQPAEKMEQYNDASVNIQMLPIQDPVPPASIPVAITAPPKKKLRVVHVNELNNAPPPAYAALKEAWDLGHQVIPPAEGRSGWRLRQAELRQAQSP